jgi:hypothetical protein
MELKKELKEIKHTISSLKLNDAEALATYILSFHQWLVKMSKIKKEYKCVIKRLYDTIPDDYISFDKSTKSVDKKLKL